MKKEKKEDPKLRFWHGWMVNGALDVRECEAIVSGPKDNPTVIGWDFVEANPKEWAEPRDEFQFFETKELAEKAQKERIAKFEKELETAKEIFRKARYWDYTSTDSVNEKVEEFLESFGSGDGYREKYVMARELIKKHLWSMACFINSGSLTINGVSFRKEDVAYMKWGKFKSCFDNLCFVRLPQCVTIVLKSDIRVETYNEEEITLLAFIFGLRIKELL